MLSKREVPLIALTLTLLTVKIAPALITGMPFSNDVWPLIRLSELFYTNPEVRVLNASQLDGLHAQWPFSILYSVIYSIVVGVQPTFFYKYIGCAVAGTSMLVISLSMARRALRRNVQRLLLLALMLYFPPLAVYTSAFLKETYAHSIMLTALMMISLPKAYSALASLLLAPALLLGHPLTSFIFSASLTLSAVDSRLELLFARPLCVESKRVPFGLTIVGPSMLLATIIYNFACVKSGLPAMSVLDFAVLAMCVMSVYLSYFLLGSVLSIYLFSLILLVASLYTLPSISAPISLGLAISATYALAVLLAGTSGGARPLGHLHAIAKSMILVVSASLIYILTYLTEALFIVHRIINYLAYAIAPYVATRLSDRTGKAVICVVATTTSIYLLAVSAGLDPLLFYWRFNSGDNLLREFVLGYAWGGNVYGDTKYAYLIGGSVRSVPLHSLLDLCNLVRAGNVLVYSSKALEYGFPVSPTDYFHAGGDLLICGSLVFNGQNAYVSGG